MQETNEKDEKIGPSYKKGRQSRSTKKIESVKSVKRWKSASETTRRRKDKKKFKRSWKSQRYTEHFQYQISEEANPHPQSQKQRRRSGQDETRNRQCFFAKFYEDLYEGESWLHRRRYGLAHWRWKNTSQPTQLHPRVYKKMRFKMPSTDWKEGKRKIAMEYELSS